MAFSHLNVRRGPLAPPFGGREFGRYERCQENRFATTGLTAMRRKKAATGYGGEMVAARWARLKTHGGN
jgi:hypothetical protein